LADISESVDGVGDLFYAFYCKACYTSKGGSLLKAFTQEEKMCFEIVQGDEQLSSHSGLTLRQRLDSAKSAFEGIILEDSTEDDVLRDTALWVLDRNYQWMFNMPVKDG
jgi:hypothetical protein